MMSWTAISHSAVNPARMIVLPCTRHVRRGLQKWCMNPSVVPNRLGMFIFLMFVRLLSLRYIILQDKREREKGSLKNLSFKPLCWEMLGEGWLPSLSSSRLFSECVYGKWKPQINSVRRRRVWKDFQLCYFHNIAQITGWLFSLSSFYLVVFHSCHVNQSHRW